MIQLGDPNGSDRAGFARESCSEASHVADPTTNRETRRVLVRETGQLSRRALGRGQGLECIEAPWLRGSGVSGRHARQKDTQEKKELKCWPRLFSIGILIL